MNKYESINRTFEKAVKLLQANLQYLADNKKVSPNFISMQNAIIKSLIDYQNQMDLLTSSLEMTITELSIGKSREFDRIRNTQTSLEAICIIHGIKDFPAWLAKGKGYLVKEAVQLQRADAMQLPYLFIQMVEKTLTPEERETLKKILFRRAKEKQEEEIKRLMQKLKINLEQLQKIKNAGTQGD